MMLMSSMTTILFLGGWQAPFGILPHAGVLWFVLKVIVCLFVFMWVRATFPRYRYDQLMRLGWKVFLPLSLGWLVITAGALMAFGWPAGWLAHVS
jgi:NADH-quinone oxidoreductase subunit H